MRKVPIFSLLVLLLVLATGVAACGGGDSVDKDAYIDQVNDSQREFTREAGELNLANPESPSAFKRSLDSLDGVLDKLIDDLEETEPPEEVSGEHEELVESLRDYDEVLAENKADLESGEQSEVVEAAEAIGRGSTEFSSTFESTIDDINRKLRD